MSNILSLEEMTRAMRTNFGWSEERADAAARKQLGLPVPSAPAASPAEIDRTADVLRESSGLLTLKEARAEARAMRAIDRREIDKFEHEIERMGDQLMLALGWLVVRFSHPGPTKQTEGIPDRKYYDPRRGVTFWWEAKTIDGEQRPDQLEFQTMAEACGEIYVLGGLGDLKAYLLRAGVVAGFTEDGTPIPIPHEAR